MRSTRDDGFRPQVPKCLARFNGLTTQHVWER